MELVTDLDETKDVVQVVLDVLLHDGNDQAQLLEQELQTHNNMT